MKFTAIEVAELMNHIRDALSENEKLIEDEIKQAVKDNAIANALSYNDAKPPIAKVDICLEISPIGNALFIESSLKISHANMKKVTLDKLSIDENQPDMFKPKKMTA